MKNAFDCCIVGGGIVGLTMALGLADHGFTVAVIESGSFNFDYDVNSYDLRVSAITRTSENIFRNLKIWDAIKAERVSPYLHMRVWEEQGVGNIEFSAHKIGEPNLGHMIENRVICKNLFQRIKAHTNIQIFKNTTSDDLFHFENNIILQLDSGDELTVKLLIGADGAQSWVRQRAEFTLDEKKYNHHAIVATVKTELPHLQTARQRFLNEGVLALLPLADPHLHSIVWSTLPEKAKELCEIDDAEFGLRLTTAFSSVLGETQVCSPRISFPLYMRHVKQYAKPRIALIGDAAHTVHPLAGQGVNLGLLDAASLLDVLVAVKKADRDIGLLQHLRKYERARKSDNQLMLLAMAGFKNLFGTEHGAVVWARNLGLNLTDKAEPVKNLFVKKAMGLVGDVPSLAQ